jgi:Tol biopolymer transport system component
MRGTPTVIAIMGASLAFGCASESDNPYRELERTRPIPAWADILLASNMHAPGEGAPRGVYALSSTDGRLDQLTFPSASLPERDHARLVPTSDANRIVVLERTAEDGEPYPGDPSGSAVFLDLDRGVRSVLSSADAFVTGIDASPVASLVVFSAHAAGLGSDIYWRELSSTNVTTQALTQTADVGERHPRFDRSGSFIVHEWHKANAPSTIWILFSVDSSRPVTQGGTGEGSLPGTPYGVGSDADPCFSPDNAWIAFRRLMSTDDGRYGDWDILTIDSSGEQPPHVIVTGRGYRGAPDWSTQGIVFTERDPSSGRWSLVAVDADGSNRRSLLTREAPTRFDSPRWIR